MDRYTITFTEKKQTSRGANYFDIQANDNKTGEVVNCIYFGNTVPKRLLNIVVRDTGSSTYNMAVIQPHQPRDKRTGRFITVKQARRTY